MNEKKKIRFWTDNAVIAALYCGLTLGLAFMSYGAVQFRIAEILLFLVFYKKEYGFGIILGCLLANCFSPLGIADVIFGTLSSVVAVLLIILIGKRLEFVALIPTIQAFIVGGELSVIFHEPYWLDVLYVALGEIAVMIVGYVIFKIIEKQNWFKRIFIEN